MKPVSNTKIVMGWVVVCLSVYGAYCFAVDVLAPLSGYLIAVLQQMNRENCILAAIALLILAAIYIGRK